ncbi:MAG: TetR/AcrR family transcriptional regulator [Bacteroidales bacterium]|nr:TetR/AcrR family transcriptional regulator [Bacteroidales bacterium]MDD3893053.1 TetR/AcrR family transcriptional regulator [Bacteroidales bacterium]
MRKDKSNEPDSRTNMRNDIVISAAGVFAKFGFKKTTVDDIAQALRKGKSSIYYYFKSKEDIFKAVVEKEADSLRVKIEEIMASEMDTIEKIRAYVETRMLSVKVMSNYHTFVNDNDVSNLDLIEKLRVKYDTEELIIIKMLLKEGMENGQFKIKDIELSSIALFTAMKGLEFPLFIKSPKADNLLTIIDDMLDILFYGLVIRNE